MNILYGVCGEGFGHSSRAKEIINHLKKQGHKILIITYGQAYPILKPLSKTLKVKGLSINFQENKLSINKTITSNIKKILHNIKNWKTLNKKINKFSPELCISDMEPIIPIYSFWNKLPLISIDNQHMMTHLKTDIPKKHKKSHLLAKTIINRIVSKANAFIILSFTKQKPIKDNAFIVSPILRKEIIKAKPKTKNFLLVYLTKPNPALIEILKKIPEKFIIYSHQKPRKSNNLKFKSLGPDFIKNLRDCKAIIASSGFTLISESLYLKKPYFAIPLQGQFEQTLNALFLKNSKLGSFSESPTPNQLKNFIKNIPKYKTKLKSHKLNPNEIYPILDKTIKNLKTQKL